MAALYVLGAIAMFALAIAQFIVGFLGFELWVGGWAWAIMFACLFFRFTLPVTVAAFFGATGALGWHWFPALVFAAPGLALMVPGGLAFAIEAFKSRPKKAADPNKAAKLAAKNAGLKGVRGWLLLLVIGLMVLGPLANVGVLINALDSAEKAFPNILTAPGWETYKAASWAIAWAAAAATFTAGYRLVKFHTPHSVRLAIIVLWVMPITIAAADIYFATTFLNMLASDAIGFETLTSLFKGYFGALIWTAYLKLSRRVKNTYYAGLQSDLTGPPVRSEPYL